MIKKIKTNKSKPIELKGGVLVLGSLAWEDEDNCLIGSEGKGKRRREWRETNFKDEIIKISLPLKYGKSSSSRLSTYTMILSANYLKKLGTGLIFPFRDEFNLRDFNIFKEQLEKLAEVEVIKKEYRISLDSNWCAIVLWINPDNNTDKKQLLKAHWNIIKPTYTIKAKELEWSKGRLLKNNFTFSTKLKIKSDLDFLICTFICPKHKDATKNTNNILPNEEEIASEMITAGYQTYFFQNRAKGIITTEDNKILKYLTKKESN
ncbi:MAG: hypothetical protein ABI855_01445 [Bacteroidota bacterium]